MSRYKMTEEAVRALIENTPTMIKRREVEREWGSYYTNFLRKLAEIHKMTISEINESMNESVIREVVPKAAEELAKIAIADGGTPSVLHLPSHFYKVMLSGGFGSMSFFVLWHGVQTVRLSELLDGTEVQACEIWLDAEAVGKVVELDDFRPGWEVGKTTCLRCYHEWIDAIPPGAPKKELECPKCHARDSLFEEIEKNGGDDEQVPG